MTMSASKRMAKRQYCQLRRPPEELVELAGLVSRLIDKYLSQGSSAADELNLRFRPCLDAIIRREITEPQNEMPRVRLQGTDQNNCRDLTGAYSQLRVLLRGDDKSTPDEMARFREDMVWRRKHFAAELGVELELTDEEWFEL